MLSIIHWRRFRSQSLYWLRNVGIDPNDRDIFSRLYVFYLIAFGGIWVAVSYSGLLTLLWHSGHSLHVPISVVMPPVAIISAIISITLTASRSPLYLNHGDLEWAITSPISARAFMPFYLVPRQFRLVLLTLLIASLGAAFVHDPHQRALAISWALWMLAANTSGWIIAALHFSRPAKPYRYFWLAVLVSLLLLVLPFHQQFIMLAQRVDPLPAHFVELSIALGILWFIAVMISSRINLISVHEASGLYADIQDLGIIYLPNRDLVQQIRNQRRLAGHRVIGHLPSWPEPYFELGRFVITLVRRPRFLFTLVELSLLFRSALILLGKTSNHWAWLFWLFIAYRFRRGHLAQFFIEDMTNPFLYQFWPEPIVMRFIQSSILPVFTVWLLTLILWVILPLGIPFTAMHLLVASSLILAWVLAEGVAVLKSLHSQQTAENYHAAAVIASGIVLVFAAVMHHMAWTPLIPFVLFSVLWQYYRREKTSSSRTFS